jgi:hypothetical protein
MDLRPPTKSTDRPYRYRMSRPEFQQTDSAGTVAALSRLHEHRHRGAAAVEVAERLADDAAALIDRGPDGVEDAV